MNKIFKILGLFTCMAIFFASCSPDDLEMGSKDVSPEELVEGIAFKIEHDKDNPNIVYLTSLMDRRYSPLWDHPQGYSQKQKVTLKIAFPGVYEVKFGVQTAGGAVYGSPVTFEIKDFHADFVNHELWVNLTGGIGKSKTWIHDNGNYGLASGEIDYADPTTEVEYNNFTPNWSPGAGHSGDEKIWGSTMTFKLDGGAFVDIHNAATDGDVDESGSFMLDVDNYTLTLTNANIMHTQGWDNKTTNWHKNLKILTLTENQLQVAVLREEISGESEWWMIWNFVSKEYADNYVPEDLPDPVPDIDGDANDILTTTNSKTWTLSLDSPYDWAGLDGTLMSNFSGKDSYLSSGWAAYNEDMISKTKVVFTSAGTNGGKFVFSSYDNSDIEGEYSIDKNNDIDFGQALNAVISESDFGWISTMRLQTSTENKLRIVRTKTDVLGNVTDMWLGQRSTEKKEYMVYHFVLGTGGSSTVDPAAAVKKMLCAHPWKLDIKGTKFDGPLTYADPATFPELTGPWTPDIPNNAWVMIDDDHGTMTFKADGTVEVVQKTVDNGAFGETKTLTGTWNYDAETLKLKLNIPILHNDNLSGVVVDWGDARLHSVGTDFVRICVVRDAALSGEAEWLFVYNYIPAN